MLNRYRIRLTKKYDFELDGRNEQDIVYQVSYLMNQTKILDMPFVRKITKILIITIIRF